MNPDRGLFGFGIIDSVLKKREGISGKCHTLTSNEYFILAKLDDFARMYNRQYANLGALARAYQDRRDREAGHYVAYRESRVRMTLLKENIDATRDILRELWRKNLAEPQTLHVKTTNGIELVTPKTKTEAYEEQEKWRITIAGTDCINAPSRVSDCIKAEILREQEATGKTTIMKAYHACWSIYETMNMEALKLYTKISEVSTHNHMAHMEKDLGLKLDFNDNIVDPTQKEAVGLLIRSGLIYVPRPPYLRPT